METYLLHLLVGLYPFHHWTNKLERRSEMQGRGQNKVCVYLEPGDSTLDYRLGLKGTAGHVRRPNPVSMKGWASLVEDRIEVRARV